MPIIPKPVDLRRRFIEGLRGAQPAAGDVPSMGQLLRGILAKGVDVALPDPMQDPFLGMVPGFGIMTTKAAKLAQPMIKKTGKTGFLTGTIGKESVEKGYIHKSGRFIDVYPKESTLRKFWRQNEEGPFDYERALENWTDQIHHEEMARMMGESMDKMLKKGWASKSADAYRIDRRHVDDFADVIEADLIGVNPNEIISIGVLEPNNTMRDYALRVGDILSEGFDNVIRRTKPVELGF